MAAATRRIQIDGVGVAAAAERRFGRRHGRLVALRRRVLQVGRWNTGDTQQSQRFFQLLVPLHRLDVLLLQMALVHQHSGLLFVPDLLDSRN